MKVHVDEARHDAGTVFHLTLDDERRLNCIGSPMLRALLAALERIASREDARAVVVRGAGERAWIGGADVRELASLDAACAERFIRALHDAAQALRRLPVPVVAVLRGYCLGGGLELAACCDLRIAADDVQLGMPEVRLGIPSVIEAALLPRLVGSARARDLVMTGRLVGAREALSIGLVDAVTTPARLETLAGQRLGELLAAAPAALRRQKALCNAWDELPLDAAIEAGVEALVESFRGPEPGEYMRGFLERRRG